MKHKTLKRVLCFLLALVVVASMPLDIHANAVAVAPWAVYALITYMAAVGITFTVTGGVDAMVKAVQDKVDEYEKTVSLPLPIWVVIEEGTKLVPPPSGGGPNWNPNRGKFFFTANATAAITAFITWLVSDGGWDYGEQIVQEKNLVEGYTHNIGAIELSQSYESGSSEKVYKLGTTFNADEFKQVQLQTDRGIMTFGVGESTVVAYLDSKQIASYYISEAKNRTFTFGWRGSYDEYMVLPLIIDWEYPEYISCYRITEAWLDGSYINYIYSLVDSIFTLDIPNEIPQLQPSTEQGVYIDTSTDAETLEELAEDIKTQFEETGTIPRPVPEVITDPDYAPQPSPVPTPPVYEDVDGLGLPSLAETMKNKFPFCLPYDLGRIFQIFYAEPVAPYWEVDLFATLGNRVPFVGDTSFTIDLAEYEDLGTISRWMTTIGYTLLLILITRQTTKW